MKPLSPLHGKEPPFVISDRVITILSDGREDTTRTIVYGCETEKRNEFTASLPKNLDNLELQNVSDNVTGPLTEITTEYKKVSDDQECYPLKWWSADADGYVYHERWKIDNTIQATREFAEYSSRPNQGLSPQGNSLNPEIGKSYVIAEASWKNDSQDGQGESGTGTDVDGNPTHTTTVTTGLSATSSMGAVNVPGDVLAVLNAGCTKALVDKVKPYAVDINSGALVFGTDYQTGNKCWIYANASPVKRKAEVDLPLSNPEQVRQIASYILTTTSASVPVITVNIKKSVYSGTKLDLGQLMTAGTGSLQDSISLFGFNLPAPQFEVPGYTKGLSDGASSVKAVTKWQKLVGSLDNVVDMKKSYQGNLLCYGEYSESYSTVTTFEVE